MAINAARLQGFRDCDFDEGLTARLTLQPGELVHLDSNCARVQVLDGTAYITRDGEDLILRQGQYQLLKRGKYTTLISAESRTPMVMEVIFPR